MPIIKVSLAIASCNSLPQSCTVTHAKQVLCSFYLSAAGHLTSLLQPSWVWEPVARVIARRRRISFGGDENMQVLSEARSLELHSGAPRQWQESQPSLLLSQVCYKELNWK